ncbi:MAG TPA: NAD(P)H-binding protein [Rubrobacter sp.]|nr:NAD(P)H-binding protein [Rubrobacter sp.]
MNASEVLVTGGTGSLGRRVVDRLRGPGYEVRTLSRSARGAGAVRGDLLTGEGLARALEGVDVLIHCASSPGKPRQTDVEGTGRLLEEAGRAGVSHFVFISIVGVDRNPYLAYYRAKLEAERIVERCPVPWTILRTTQFHEFVLKQIRLLERLPVMMVPRGFLLQPMDIGEVADRMVEFALSEPAGRVPDIGGPEVRTLSDLARSYLKATGRRRRVVEVPVPGKAARALREGALLAPDQAYGEIRWEDFLGQTIQPKEGDGTKGGERS